MGYKPPVEIWCNDFMDKIVTEIQENNEMKIMAVINQHVSVDKEELIKALNYDRHQYEKGYADAKAEYQRPQGEWYYGEDECGQDGWFCSECGFFVPWYYQYYEKDINFIRDYKACPHCLAEMVTYTGKDRDTKGGAEECKE